MHVQTMIPRLLEHPCVSHGVSGLDLQVLPAVGYDSWCCPGYSKFCLLEVIPVGFSLTCAEQRWDAEKMPSSR